MSPGQDAFLSPVMVLSSPFRVPMWPSMVGRLQTRSPVSGFRACTSPTMPNSPPELPVTISGPCASVGTISGAAV